ncbi:MAG: aldo/keto reductase [Oxalobacter formigenes]|nr:aldo/keto reductase [Oxalobacter formigenes]
MSVGCAVKDSGIPRNKVWITSKLWPNEFGEGITEKALDRMLKRMELDYINLVYLHQPAGNVSGAWKNLVKAQREGKVRVPGISNLKCCLINLSGRLK